MYIRVYNETITFPYDPIQLRLDYPNVSFPLQFTDEILNQYNVYRVEYQELPAFDQRTQYAIHEESPTYENNKWVIRHIVLEKDQSAIDAYDEYNARSIRTIRDNHLNDSDWVVLKAYELGESVSEDWKTYRQALRDIPMQSNFPYDIVWPNNPGDL